MAENKKGFILYADLIHTVEKMPKEKAGDLLLTILRYVNDQDPVVEDIVVDLVFEPIKQQLKRDLRKYEDRAERSRNNGKLGGRPPKPKKPSGLIENLDKPKKPDTDKDIVKDIDILERKQSFLKQITSYAKANPDKYPKELYKDFLEYWTEHGMNDKKMRFEKEKSFGLSRRLSTWNRNGFNDYSKPKEKPKAVPHWNQDPNY